MEPTTPQPSAVDTHISLSTSKTDLNATLAHEILHNLQHAHNWTDLSTSNFSTHPYTLICGTPPTRLYIHPDEQAHMLAHKLRETDLPPKKEWVLPVAQGRKWTLRSLNAVFEGIEETEEDQERRDKGWGGKRLLLAIVGRGGMGGDGTVVYYTVGEGEVKPRQN